MYRNIVNAPISGRQFGPDRGARTLIALIFTDAWALAGEAGRSPSSFPMSEMFATSRLAKAS
jgi:hypothetical protein